MDEHGSWNSAGPPCTCKGCGFEESEKTLIPALEGSSLYCCACVKKHPEKFAEKFLRWLGVSHA